MTDGAIVQIAPEKIIYRASALGGCTKALVAARLEYEPLASPEKSMALFSRGHEYEVLTLDRLKDDGWQLFGKQREVILPITKRIAVVGHLDAKGWPDIPARLPDNCQPYVVEVKSQGQAAWNEFEKKGWDGGLFPKYKWQISVYMHATGLSAAVVRALRADDGTLEHYDVQFIDEPFYSLAEIRTRILLAESLALTGVVPTECDIPSFPCPYYYLHEDLDREMLEDEQIDVLAREHDDAKRDLKAAEGRVAAAKKALRTAVGDSDRSTTSSGTKITFYKGTTKWVDQNAMKKDGVHEKYLRESTWEGLKVTLPKDKEVDDDDTSDSV